MTAFARCNNAGPLAKRIPTWSLTAFLLALLPRRARNLRRW